ncbi:MAG: HD domain-containing phosphohydrolase [candidate division Zixibacteria bacterium]
MFDRSLKEIQDDQKVQEITLDKLGREFISVLFATLKIASMYEPNNNRYIEQGNQLRSVMKKIFNQESDFTLNAKGGYIYLCDVRLKSSRESDDAMTYFLENWRKLGISGFTFMESLDPRELDKFIFFLSGFEPGEDAEENYRLIASRLNDLRIERVSPNKYSVEDDLPIDEDEAKKIRVKARKTFFSALAVVQNNAHQVKNQNTVNIAKTKRAVQGLVDVILKDESAMLELTTLRHFDDYTYVHSVNVCVLSLVLGYHLGLDKKRMSQLGVGALLHDIGKMKLPVELINKPDEYDDNDWQLMRKHPVFGIKFLYKTRAVEETTARASTAIFEHHISYNGAGYPELLNRRMPTLYARIVSIADTYNAMSSGRVYHRKTIMPDEVITNMVNRVGKDFDPLLLKLFVNAIGIYPVGTIVTMSNKEIGIVARNNPSDPENPEIKVIGNESGMFEKADVKIIDLSQEEGVSITRMIDGDEFNIDNAEYLDIG